MAYGQGAANFSFSQDGTLFYAPARSRPEGMLMRVDREGVARPIGDQRRAYSHPRLSPDGQRLAVNIHEGTDADVWLHEFSSGTWARFTFEGRNVGGIWTPDGRSLTFSFDRGAGLDVVSKDVDFSGGVEQLMSSDTSQFPSSWSPDGGVLAVTEIRGASDISMLDQHGDGSLQRFIDTPAYERSARFSPDGRWLAYTSNETGRDEVYVQAFPGPGGKRQVSTHGGIEPVWAQSGTELFYRNGDEMFAVAVEDGPGLVMGPASKLFEGAYDVGGLPEFAFAMAFANYDVFPDGREFIMVRTEGEAEPTEVRVVVNWFEELKRLVPTP